MELTNENYFSQENNEKYMSCSQFKDFMKCEVEALAKAKGELVEEKSPALLFGGYVDAYFSNELDTYLEQYGSEMINSKTGELKAPFKNIGEVIKAIESDELMMEYLNGQKQVVMTGEIAGVLFKIKVDALHDDMIVDQKIMSSIQERIWVEDCETHRNIKTDFVEAFGYTIQGAIYQEIVRQNTGKKLPFILAVCSKEENPDKALIQIDQEYLDKALELVRELAPHFDFVKKGLVDPKGCGKCASCRKDLKCTKVVSYKEMFNKGDINDGEELE